VRMNTNSFLSEGARIGGTLVWYYFICKRQVWLMARGIEPERRDDALIEGRLLGEHSYARDRHSIQVGDSNFDIIRREAGIFVVGEIKKSSRFEQAAKMQLAHYLYVLLKKGIRAEGELLFPKERKKEKVVLDPLLEKSLEKIYREINKIANSDRPPELKRNRYCTRCAYRYWCWS